MLHFPTMFGYLVAKLPGRKLKPTSARSTRAGERGRPIRAGHLPIGLYKRRAAKAKHLYTAAGEAAECCCFRYCDLLYQQFSPEEKALWQRGIKKSGMSAYDLWMAECLTLTIQRKRPPDYPSISGGWSNTKVAEGSTLDAAPCWPLLVDPPPIIIAQVELDKAPPNPRYRVDVTWAADLGDWPAGELHVEPAAHVEPPGTWAPCLPIEWPNTSELYTFGGLDLRPYWALRWPRWTPRLFAGLLTEADFWTLDHPNARPWPAAPAPPSPWPNPLL